MATGCLTLHGWIEVAQFWPWGDSDADTIKVTVARDAAPFRFAPRAGVSARATRVFDDARVVGRTTKPAVDAHGRVTVRLEGLDAPELHYRPSPSSETTGSARLAAAFRACNAEFRQPFGERAAHALGRAVAQRAGRAARIRCVVRTRVDRPSEAFDTYGRLVGSVWLGSGANAWCANTWLLASGWAVPALYTSMSAREIAGVLRASATAARCRRGFYGSYSDSLGGFEWQRRYRGPRVALDAREDGGAVLFPKVFRRVASWRVLRKCGATAMDFAAFWDKPGRRDYCYATSEYLAQGTKGRAHRLTDFVARRRLTARPEALVFKEAASALVGPRGAARDEW